MKSLEGGDCNPSNDNLDINQSSDDGENSKSEQFENEKKQKKLEVIN